MTLLTKRALLLAKVETTFGTDAVPDPTNDALLIREPDFSADITTIVRDNVQQDLSPSGVITGRKIGSITFQHEVRGSGSVGTAPALGTLLKGCGYAETAVIAVGGTDGYCANWDPFTNNAGIDWDSVVDGGTLDTTNYPRSAEYIASIVNSAATPTIRVTGGNKTVDNDTDAAHDDSSPGKVPCEKFEASVGGTSPTMTLTVNYTDPLIPLYTVGGTFQAGDILTATILGLDFSYTVVGGDVDNDGAALGLAGVIAAHALITATAVATDIVTVGFTGAYAGTVVTSGATALTLGASGMTVTPTFTGTPTLNDRWTVVVKPLGYEYDPVSASFDSLSMYLYLDGLFHKLTGARGTFTLEGNGGEEGIFSFEFQGNYFDATDVAIPTTSVLETTIPPAVELADLAVRSYTIDGVPCEDDEVQTLCAAGFSVDAANEITPKECINNANSFDGVIITDREPVGSVDPQAELVAVHPAWTILSAGTVLDWRVRIGAVRGNILNISAPRAQYSNIAYGDRNSIRTWELDLAFSRVNGNDELRFSFN